jgi:acetyltransferase-like isoleucine patch superfamily enzyme
MFDTPILFLIFNRPDTTARVFEQIKKVQPKYLFVAADGARKEKPGEEDKCIASKDLILHGVDWDCELKTLFKEDNLGCGLAVSGAITWFFENVEQGIIIEDDCIPDISFFEYCESLLRKYSAEEKVMHISGNSFCQHPKLNEASYYFSGFPFIWGWATWKRAWKNYDLSYHDFDENQRRIVIRNAFENKDIRDFWEETLNNHIILNVESTWDYQWFFSIWKANGVTILPGKNLVSNIGFGMDATHTKNENHHLSANAKYQAQLPLRHPQSRMIISKNEIQNFHNFFKKKESKFSKVKSIMMELFQKIIQSFLFRTVPESRVLFNNKITWNNLQDHSIESQMSSKAKLYSPYSITNCKIGDFTYISDNSQISETEIGKFCSIGPHFLCGWGIHPIDGVSTHPMFYSTKKQNGVSYTNKNKIVERKPIKIGNDVFIGANVTILDGVEIGDGAIIGAGAIVSKDIPPYAIAVGSPITIIRKRFDEKTINKLLKIKWWNWEESELKNIEKQFFDIPGFIAKYEQKSPD